MADPQRNAATAQGAVELSSVRFAYRRGFELAIDHLNIAPGEHVLLSGASGSGKSTLLNLIAGLEQPSQGTILINGTDIAALPPSRRDSLRGRHIGMIFQSFNLLHGFTALENVMVALMLSGVSRSEQRLRGRAALARLGISHPYALVESLSVGQQQRVAVARAIVGGPSLVLADEPTASLDPDNAHSTIELIREAASGASAALIVTSHDPTLRELFPRIVDIAQFTPGVQG